MNETTEILGNEETQEIPFDPAKLEALHREMRSEQNLPLGLTAGLVAALVGASVWAAVTAVSGYQIGWMAVGVGFLVGFAIRIGGRGVDPIFGISGAALALFGCALGNLMATCIFIAKAEEVAFMTVVTSLTPSIVGELMVATFSPMDVLFYGIAVYEGYRLSFAGPSDEQLASLTPAQTA